jgi:hypothetical protein
LQPSPHFDDPPQEDEPPEPDPPTFEAEPDPEPEDDDEIAYPEPSSEQTLLPPPHFHPFFTLIEDSTSGEHYHPYVHYVFADDDPVIVTAAAIRSLGLDDTKYLPQNTPDGEEDRRSGEEGKQEHGPDAVESPLPPPVPGIQERYVILDVGADGHSTIDAQSLSSGWQITDTQVRAAPSFGEESAEHGYMLRVEGIEVPGRNKGKEKGERGESRLKDAREKNQGDVFAALDGLVKSLEGGLEVAGKINGVRGNVRESEATVLEAVSLGVGEEGKDGDG